MEKIINVSVPLLQSTLEKLKTSTGLKVNKDCIGKAIDEYLDENKVR